MPLKHVYMGWKFQTTLKLDIFFLSLEHFFISVAIFKQVATASLKIESNELRLKYWRWFKIITLI